MKKKIRSMMLLIVMSMIFTSCGSADTDAGNKKDDLSDVVVLEVERPGAPIPYDNIKNLYGCIYTNTRDYLEKDKRYFTSLSIANNRADDGSGNWIETHVCPGEILKNWKPDYKLLQDGIDDLIQYCEKNDIPYLLLTRKYSEEEIKEVEAAKLFTIEKIQLCISPDEFFQYELFPQLTYAIGIVDDFDIDEQWDNFVNNHN